MSTYRVDVLRAIGHSGCYAHAIADALRAAFRHLVEERNGLAIGEHAAGQKTAGRRDDLGGDLASSEGLASMPWVFSHPMIASRPVCGRRSE